MILESITLEGFRCFDRRVELTGFQPGMNILSGPNGSGKSTVLRGLRHALLDSHATSGVAAREAMQPWGRELSPRFQVVFRHEGERWRAEKQFLSSPMARLEREENGTFRPVAEGNLAVERLRKMFSADAPAKGLAGAEHLGWMQVLWTAREEEEPAGWSVGVRQAVEASLGAVIASPKGRAIENAVKKTALEYFTPTWKARAPQEAGRVTELEGLLREARAAWEAANQRAEQLTALRTRLRAEGESAEAAEAERKRLEQRMGELAGLREKLANARTSEATERNGYERLQQTVETWQTAVGSERKLLEEAAQLAERLGKLRAVMGELAQRQGAHAAQRLALEALEEQGRDANEWLAAAPPALLLTAERALEVEPGEPLRAGETRAFSGDGVRVPGVARIRVEAGRVRETILARRPEWASAPPDVARLREEYKSARAALEKDRIELDRLTGETQRESATVETLQRQNAANLEKTRGALAQWQGGPGLQELQGARDEAALRLAGARARVGKLERELAALGGDPEVQWKQATERAQAARARLERTREEAARLEGQVELTAGEGLYGRVSTLEEDLAENRAKVARYEKQAAAIDRLRREIGEAGARLAAALPARLGESATEIWRRIAGEGQVTLDGNWKAQAAHVPVRHLSGGETEQVALATRLALAEHLAREEKQLAVFDDAFLATDPERAARILDILSQASERLQILILTCHPERYENLLGATRQTLER